MLDTQRDAFESIRMEISSKRKLVLEAIRLAGKSGATLFELVDLIGWPVNCVSGRVTELADREEIADSGARRENPASGKRAVVWIAWGNF